MAVLSFQKHNLQYKKRSFAEITSKGPLLRYTKQHISFYFYFYIFNILQTFVLLLTATVA